MALARLPQQPPKQSYGLCCSIRHEFCCELYFGGICFTSLPPEKLHKNRRAFLFIWWGVLISLKFLYFLFEPIIWKQSMSGRKWTVSLLFPEQLPYWIERMLANILAWILIIEKTLSVPIEGDTIKASGYSCK